MFQAYIMKGKWAISGESPIFWPPEIIPHHLHPEKNNPLVEKNIFHEKSVGNNIPCKLSKSGVPTPSERWDIDPVDFFISTEKNGS